MAKVGFALVGTGNIAREHAKAINSIEEAELVAVYSSSYERAKEFCSKYGGSPFSDYNKLLRLDSVCVVDIANMNYLHADYGIIAAEAGKHVIVEKPIDISMEKAKGLVKACEEGGVKLTVISQYRYDKNLIKLKRMIEDGKLGKIVMCNVSIRKHRDQRYYASSGGWRMDKKRAGGGIVIMHAIHYIDILVWLFGDIVELRGETGTVFRKINIEDTAVAFFRFKNGILGTLAATSCLRCNMPDKLEIYGTKGSVILENGRIYNWSFSKSRGLNILSSVTHFLLPSTRGTIKKQMQVFINSINGSGSTVTGEDGLKSLKLALSLYGKS